MERIDRDNYKLSSGRLLYANRGLISIVTVRNGFEIAEGYDGPLSGEIGDAWDFTDSERRELAEFMIAQWTAYRDALKG